jgi:RHS repeat-associated protein
VLPWTSSGWQNIEYQYGAFGEPLGASVPAYPEVEARLQLAGSAIAYYMYPWNNTIFVHANALSSAMQTTDNTGAVVHQLSYYPWGQIWVNSGTDYWEESFAGQEMYMSESGLSYTPNRMYGATPGRWMSPDPLAGEVTNPQSLNRYAYALNNPTSLTDPAGLGQCPPGVPSSMCVNGTYYPPAGAYTPPNQPSGFSNGWDEFELLNIPLVTTSYTWVQPSEVDTYIMGESPSGLPVTININIGLIDSGYWSTSTTQAGTAFDLIGPLMNNAATALDNAYGAALSAAGQVFRGRPPGQSFAACVGQNMSLTFTGKPNSPIRTTVTSGITAVTGLLLGGPSFGGVTLAELGTYTAAYFTGATIPEAIGAGLVVSDAALGAGLIGLGPLVGSAANCASVGVAP